MNNEIRIKQNLDTGFLKLIAIICMAVDHVSKVFFPDSIVLAVIGRIAFPLFAYCIVVGCIYTRNVYKYIARLGVFALLSQPIYTLASHPTWAAFQENIFVPNIFFTLIAGTLAVTALMDIKKNWWMLIIPLGMEMLIGLDYGLYGIIMMVLFYVGRKNSWLSALMVVAWMSSQISGDFLTIGSFGLNRQFFAILALPLIYVHTDFKPNVHKYFFYAFYPAHLLVIYLLRLFLHV